jgi:hypothetical protein
MELTDLQKETVKQWVLEGVSLSDIQKNIASEFDIKLTFMDVRFLVLDLDVEIKDTKSKRPVEKVEAPAGPTTPPPEIKRTPQPQQPAGPYAAQQPAGPYAPPPPPTHTITDVSVDIDTLMTPGYLVSGTVTFTDGVAATWGLTQEGQLALDAKQEGYKPSPEDIQAFQQKLKALIESKGMM